MTASNVLTELFKGHIVSFNNYFRFDMMKGTGVIRMYEKHGRSWKIISQFSMRRFLNEFSNVEFEIVK